jgi:PhnB protein
MAVNYKPAETQNVVPYLIIRDADKEIAFLKEVFGAKQMEVHRDPSGRVMHAQVKIGDSVVMMGESTEQWAPLPAAIYVFVPDVDAAYKRALPAGATSNMEPGDRPYGDRNAGVKDANGVQWWIGTHIEDVSEEEMLRRMAAGGAKQG